MTNSDWSLSFNRACIYYTLLLPSIISRKFCNRSHCKMSLSKNIRYSEDIEIKTHYQYHGSDRCTVLFVPYHSLISMELPGFIAHVKNEIPYLGRMNDIRICYKDLEDHWVDIDQRTYKHFINMGLKINIRIHDAQSPASDKSYRDRPCTSTSKRQLEFSAQVVEPGPNPSDSATDAQLTYRSPMEIELSLKEDELNQKKSEIEEYKIRFENLDSMYNPKIPKGTKKLCHNCHSRDGHSKARCPHPKCDSAAECGEIDVHPSQKRELSELASLKNKSDGDYLKLKHEFETKKKIYTDMTQTFEARIHTYLINSNPSKYLIGSVGPNYKKRVVDADKAILRKHYNGKVPSNLYLDSQSWQAIIDAYKEKFKLSSETPKETRNPVLDRIRDQKRRSSDIEPRSAQEASEHLSKALKLSAQSVTSASTYYTYLPHNSYYSDGYYSDASMCYGTPMAYGVPVQQPYTYYDTSMSTTGTYQMYPQYTSGYLNETPHASGSPDTIPVGLPPPPPPPSDHGSAAAQPPPPNDRD